MTLKAGKTKKRTTPAQQQQTSEDAFALHPAQKTRRLMRSDTARVRAANRVQLLETVAGPVLSRGYLRWYEAENFSQISKACRAAWDEQKDAYGDWGTLLRELHSNNCTNRCRHCEQIILLRANRQFCTVSKWNGESAKRTSDFHGVVDLLMTSGVLNWKEKGRVCGISKTCYAICSEHCICSTTNRSAHIVPFLDHDPRHTDDFDQCSDFQKCRAVAGYTSLMIRNLHSFYNFDSVTDSSRLPSGLGGWTWFDTPMVTLQRGCPQRYAFVMNLVSLSVAQGELQRCAPLFYATAFLGQRYDPVQQSESFQAFMGAGISNFCLPATDEMLGKFLREKCYPSIESQQVLGPLLARRLSIFSPFMDMVSLDDESARICLPRSLERLTGDVIEAMSMQFFCTIS